MMNLAWSVLFATVLLTPGVGFWIGLFFQRRVDRHLIAPGGLALIAALVVFSFFSHAIGVLAADTIGNPASLAEVLRLVTPHDSAFSSASAAKLHDHVFDVAAYFAAQLVFGFIVGKWVAGQIRGGRLAMLVRHRWLLDITEPDEAGGTAIVYAYVLSHIHAGDDRVLYEGILSDYEFSDDGGIGYIVLESPQKSIFRVGQPQSRSRRKKKLYCGAIMGSGSEGLKRFQIEGEDIANLFVERLVI